MLCGVQAVIVGCCMFFIYVDWFQGNMDIPFFLVYICTCICCIFLYVVSWAMIF